MADNPACPICHEAAEDVEHLLFLCPWTRPIWFGSVLQWTPADQTAIRFDLWLQENLKLLSNNEETYDQNLSLLLNLCWYIWKGRNLKLFEDREPNPEVTLSIANQAAWETCNELIIKNSNDSQLHSNTVNQRKKWLPPPEDFLKCNSDATFDKNRHICSIGTIIRDEHGKVLTGAAKILPASSPLHAEANAMREAHFLAASLGIKHIIYESDNQELIEICKEKETNWQISPIIHEIGKLKKSFDTVAYTWFKREINHVTDEIANIFKDFKLPRFWAHFPPSSLQQKLDIDKISTVEFSKAFN